MHLFKRLLTGWLYFLCAAPFAFAQLSLDWGFEFGSPQPAFELIHAMSAPQDGKLWVSGFAGDGTDFDPGPAVASNPPRNSYFPNFLAQYDTAGALLQLFPLWSNSGEMSILAITSDAQSNVIVSGRFRRTFDLDLGPGVNNQTVVSSATTYFLAKYDPNGNLQWFHDYGPDAFIDLPRVVTLPSGSIIFTGNALGAFYASPSNFSFYVDVYTSPWSSTTAFAIKYSPAGQCLQAIPLMSTENIYISEVKFSDHHETYIAGTFKGSLDVDPGPGAQIWQAPLERPYFLKLDSALNLTWIKQIDCNQGWFQDMVVGDQDTLIFSGTWEQSLDADPGPGTHTLNTPPGPHASGFLLKLDSAGSFADVKAFINTQTLEFEHLTFSVGGDLIALGTARGSHELNPGGSTSSIFNFGADIGAGVFLFDDQFGFQTGQVWTHGEGTQARQMEIDALGNVYVALTYADSLGVESATSPVTFMTSPSDWNHALFRYGPPCAPFAVQPAGSNLFDYCLGDTIRLALDTAGNYVQWQVQDSSGFTDLSNGSGIGGAQSTSLWMATSLLGTGTHTLGVETFLSCDTSFLPINITITEPPVAAFTAALFQDSVALTNQSQHAVSCVWDFGDGSPLDSSVHTSHTYAASGLYTIMLICDNGICADTSSEQVRINIVGLAQASETALRVFPVPVQALVTMRMQIATEGMAQIELYDLHGRPVRTWKARHDGGDFEFRTDLSALPSGSYLLRLVVGDYRAARLLILE